ncbi:CMP-sialic acid transporter 2 [Colletotrichum spaethianum]|uniref:CMP-sialic acid transporter 2 n=1 Tax=Colletotrichum spaethianum TaxID=700344 RepID=A0AA37L782_9PEZI|nr:CMP-sialic acid transporter 2 [Colletotrichum spaethianum]GKT43301.1 CMP-sialic acid transporter 2 [Colletotrichum spaethianum]
MLRHGSILGFFLKPLGWIPGGPQQAAYAAALGLVAIQVGIGIIMKIAQTGGSYSFSPSASVTISEFFKMVLSTIFFYNECKRRVADGIRPSTRGGGNGYASLATSELPLNERSSLDEKREEEGLNGNASSSSNGNVVDKHTGPLPPLDFRTYWSYVRGEVTRDVRYGFCNLALFYVLINNSIFVSYKMADPGTIQLTKSGVTFITALVMIATLNTKISKIQWIAILMQICGLMVTQYNPQTGTTYPFSTYFILLFQVFLSASSGVYNQALLKTDDSSLHADNMILYGAGAAMNLLCHLVIKTLKADEPGFFEGYNSFGAIMVIVSNVFIGLAITAVYKYADAVIKCFATAVATGILLYVSPILFGTKLSFLVLPGTVVVFVASWLYMDNPPPKDPNPPPSNEPQKMSLFSKMAAVARKFNKIFLGVATFITVLIVAFLTMSEAKMPDFAKDGGSAPSTPSGPKPVTGSESTVESPFKNTLAMIRWNSARPERIPLLQKYEPFFHTVHISMPNMFKAEDPEFHNLTHDQFPGTFTVYKQVSRTMKLILDTQPEIDGLMYYHFDAWIDPLGWTGMNPYNIHFPAILDTAPPSHGGPEFMCLTNTKNYNWWGWGQDFHRTAMAAASVVDNFDLEYTIRRDEFCVGWSDIYYIPRRFFADYIFLSEIFAGFGVFHEVAIPTIVHIIDQSRRRNPHRSIIDHISDCWGNCCSSNPKIRDVLGARCGHRLNYLEDGPINAFYDKLDAQAEILGQTLNSTKYAMSSSEAAHLFDSAALATINNGEAKKVAPTNDDALEDDQRADKLAAEKAKQEKEKLKDEHAPVDKTGKPGDPKADPSKVPPPPPKDDKEGAKKEEGKKEGEEKKESDKKEADKKEAEKKVDPNDALREGDRDADVKRRLRREVLAAVAGLGY